LGIRSFQFDVLLQNKFEKGYFFSPNVKIPQMLQAKFQVNSLNYKEVLGERIAR
jgi:hypothetical protein